MSENYISNDASLFTAEDGAHTIFWSDGAEIWQAGIELPSCHLLGEKHLAIPASRSGWDTHFEGSVVLRHGAWHYLFFSSFTRSYEIGVARARSIHGPWMQQPNNPVITPKPPLTNIGHNRLFKGPDGRYWICYIMQFNGKESPERLAYDPSGLTRKSGAKPTPPLWGLRSSA